ncbi:hypothetical protein KZ126_004965 [Salmonella enterica]|nr:hypothetical protein [Salmonella enterica]EBY3151558.1 hypothetical protein [Salmonella enterica subsp. enterica serovar Teshie]ECD6622041.1 hypothetical protein [Salmonella enterica subsp. enterica]ECF3547467.1 hypothetical protein [Salmonella enterica subsp. enterica]ECJ5185849.1 hypothetical protein [Salmonella enterica subsp. enterica]
MIEYFKIVFFIKEPKRKPSEISILILGTIRLTLLILLLFAVGFAVQTFLPALRIVREIGTIPFPFISYVLTGLLSGIVILIGACLLYVFAMLMYLILSFIGGGFRE